MSSIDSPPTAARVWPSTACSAVRTMSSRERLRNCSAARSIPGSVPSILTMHTPSICTGTPCVVYVSCVRTSNCMSSSDRRWTFSRIGHTNVPPPRTIR